MAILTPYSVQSGQLGSEHRTERNLWRSVSRPENGALSPAGAMWLFFFFFPDWGTLLCTPYFVWDIIPSRNNRAVELNWGIIMLLCLHTHTHTHTLLTLNIECNLHWYQPWQLNAPSNCHPPKRSEMPTGALQRYRTPSVLRKLQ